MKAVLIEGASTAYGSGDLEQGGWASRLHHNAIRYSTENPEDPVVVANFSYPGQTIRRTAEYLGQDIARIRSPSELAIIISVGINEAKIAPGEDKSILDIDTFDATVRQCVEIAKGRDIESVLVGPQRIDDTRTQPTFYGSVIKKELVNEYGQRVADIAAEMDAHYIDVGALQQPYPIDKVIAADGLHPTSFGHELIYQAVEDKLIALGVIWTRNYLMHKRNSILRA